MSRKFVKHPLIKDNTIETRLYQETIFASTTKGNSLVILPTGLGKTIIFIMLAAHRLTKFPNKKVIICAPTKPLLDQHEITIKEIMNIKEDLIIQLSGQINPTQRKQLWDKAKIIICTPQTLQNDIIQNRVNLDSISLLCLDEAHKAVGDHSYVFIADRYNTIAHNPLILAITASPGSEIEKINEIKKNLNIDNIEMRDETSPDVIPYVHNIKEEWIKIKLPEEFKVIIDILNNLFKEILKGLKELQIINSADPRNISRKDLLNLHTKVNQKYSAEINSDTKNEFFTAMSLVGNSIRISHAIELIETQGVPSLLRYLQGQINDLKMGKGSQALKKLLLTEEMQTVLNMLKKLEEKKIIHPKINALKDIIKQEIKNNPSNRILVFAHYRITSKIITEQLNQLKEIKAHWFVGQASSARDKGLSQKEQIEIIRAFRDGKYNVLVSTSVAEEGLDIGECDLVIFYDAVPSAIRLIQRKGRTGRRREGRVILLIAEGTRDEGYVWASKRKTQKMKKIIETMQSDKKYSPQQGIINFLENKKITKNSREINKTDENNNETKTPSSKQDIIKVKEEHRSSALKTNNKKLTIIVDSRERNSTIVKELVKRDVHIIFEKLTVGDYICSDQVVVERKEKDDFISSIMDNRLFNQAKLLSSSTIKPIMLIEGKESLFSSALHPHAIAGSISALAVDFGIPLIFTKNQYETAEILYSILKREQEEKKRSISIGIKKGAGLKNQLEKTVATFPHVDYKMATRLLRKFGSLRELILARREEYKELKGIGEKIANDIIEYTYTNYNEIETGENTEEAIDDLIWLKKQSEKDNK